jgi:hypothetical protein
LAHGLLSRRPVNERRQPTTQKKEAIMIRHLALAIAVAALTTTLAHAGPRGEDVQAHRGEDVQAPRGEDVQAPRAPALPRR